MDPLFYLHDYSAQLLKNAEVVVELGGRFSFHYLKKECKEHHSSIAWMDCEPVPRSWKTRTLQSRGATLEAKCHFLRVNQLTLLIFHPHGRFADVGKLHTAAADWIREGGNITDSYDFQKSNSLWNSLEEGQSSPERPVSAVQVEDRYEAARFIEEGCKLLTDRGYVCEKTLNQEVREYGSGNASDGNNLEFLRMSAIIHGFVVTFLLSKRCRDREATRAFARDKFRSAHRFVTLEELQDFFPILRALPVAPRVYRETLAMLSLQITPLNTFEPEGEEAPIAVSKMKYEEEKRLLRVLTQHGDQNHQSPQEYYLNRYLEPRRSAISHKICREVKEKGSSRRETLFAARFGDLSVTLEEYDRLVLVTVTEEGAEGSVTFITSDDTTDRQELSLWTYNGLLPEITRMMDTVLALWNIDLFQAVQ